MVVEIIIGLLIGYLLGSVNPAILLSKIKGKDIRELGSGNAGATNTLRNYGKGAALTVTCLDILKCVIAILLSQMAANLLGIDVLTSKVFAGVGCILGHNYPLYFGFKGGKGVLVSVTAIFMLDYRVGLIAILTFIIVFALSRYVSLGSVSGAAAAIISSAILSSAEVKIFCIFAGILAILRHKTNIERLRAGTESKTTFKSNK
ncbi:MAG: glycerol-3-phosphate 1-O-acyltransferase PlsY [Bacillota bacterium]|nr:glycerol-3-phosphate 1-O-acyltransferase PlsY [Bacillota bacterium]